MNQQARRILKRIYRKESKRILKDMDKYDKDFNISIQLVRWYRIDRLQNIFKKINNEYER